MANEGALPRRPAPGPDDAGRPGPALAERLNYLFAKVHPRDRGEYTLDEVATGMAERRGVAVTPQYLSQLRRGHRKNPRRDVLEGLADFFGVNTSYFFDEKSAEQIAAELGLYAVMRDAEVRAIALRLPDLSTEGLRALAGIIEHFRRVEGLAGHGPAPPEDTGTAEGVARPRRRPRGPRATDRDRERE